MKNVTIRDVRAFTLAAAPSAYAPKARHHWLQDDSMATQMALYPAFARDRTAWGIDAVGTLLVEIELDNGVVGWAIGQGGEPACYLVERLFKRFLVGSDPRDHARLWDLMFRAGSFNHGRKGIAILALSIVDLALWDALGRWRDEPVYKLIGGAVRDSMPIYYTGPRAIHGQHLGFVGAKVTLPHAPAEGPTAWAAAIDFVRRQRAEVGPGFPLMVDAWTSLSVQSAADLALALQDCAIDWFEEALHPDDWEGYGLLRQRVPGQKWATGEHEYTRYGFRRLIEGRAIDLLQPDLRWCGGLSEALRIAAQAAAYDIPVAPHSGGVYSYHFAATQPLTPYVEYVSPAPEGDVIAPMFGGLCSGEPLPVAGTITLTDAPGFGLTLDRQAAQLKRPYA